MGLMVLGEAAKSSLLCLQMLMSLHINPKTEQDGIIEENVKLLTAIHIMGWLPRPRLSLVLD